MTISGALRGVRLSLLSAVAVAALLRGVYPAADPPVAPSVGIVWHDEGAWVHNARNRALFGSWRTDEWNPIFVAPVFTGLEYVAFNTFGVGVRQARLVSELAGVISVALLALGVRRLAGDVASLVAGWLAATNYVYVMYDRVALMEALMTSFIVASWYCSTRAEDRPYWGAGAGCLAVMAYFTKAAAAFYVGALGVAAVWTLWDSRSSLRLKRQTAGREGTFKSPAASGEVRLSPETISPDLSVPDRTATAAIWMLVGLITAFAVALLAFVLPHWAEYRFYNWQMSVTRKPSYDLPALIVRASWFPILHDTFTRMWFVLTIAVVAVWGIALRWRRARTAERLLVLWAVAGTAELLVHDVGNERRFVFLIPVAIALASVVLGRGTGLLPPEACRVPRRRVWLTAPFVLYSMYIVCGPIGRLPFFYAVSPSVRLSAACATAVSAAVLIFWPSLARTLSGATWTGGATLMLTAIVAVGDVVQFGQWAAGRTYKNYEASRLLGRVLPDGSLVQGKLANGLALENGLRPLFIGHGFGNYADRNRRNDVQYLLTYVAPKIGYEGSQILDVINAYPDHRIIMTFEVAETATGHDRAALIDKFGAGRDETVTGGRAKD